MLVHVVGAGQQFLEFVHADVQGDGQADGGPEGIAAAHPVPEAEHVGRVDAEFAYRRFVGGYGDEVLGNG